ncbi:MAG: hypothetical protein ACREXR_04790 [Gammaproteobacteria bacterium]
MKSLLRNAFALSALLAWSGATAGNGSGKVVHLIAHAGDIVMFKLDESHTGKPACSSNEWALSLSTHSGRAMYALLLSAHSQGKRVVVQGADACSAWSDREAPIYIYMQ